MGLERQRHECVLHPGQGVRSRQVHLSLTCVEMHDFIVDVAADGEKVTLPIRYMPCIDAHRCDVVSLRKHSACRAARGVQPFRVSGAVRCLGPVFQSGGVHGDVDSPSTLSCFVFGFGYTAIALTRALKARNWCVSPLAHVALTNLAHEWYAGTWPGRAAL